METFQENTCIRFWACRYLRLWFLQKMVRHKNDSQVRLWWASFALSFYLFHGCAILEPLKMAKKYKKFKRIRMCRNFGRPASALRAPCIYYPCSCTWWCCAPTTYIWVIIIIIIITITAIIVNIIIIFVMNIIKITNLTVQYPCSRAWSWSYFEVIFSAKKQSSVALLKLWPCAWNILL